MIFLELFLTFLKIGAFTFGGGYAMIPLIRSETISRGWITEAQFTEFIAVSESTPGPLAVNIATYIGSDVAGIAGAACATLGIIFPSFVIILIVARSFELFKENKYVKNAMTGIRSAVIALIAAALLSIGITVFFPSGITNILSELQTPAFFVSLGIFATMTIAAFKKIHPVLIILMSAAIGIASGFAFGI